MGYSLNLYAYVANDPLIHVDPSGNDMVIVFSCIAYCVVGQHSAILIGNDRTGWTLFSREGFARRDRIGVEGYQVYGYNPRSMFPTGVTILWREFPTLAEAVGSNYLSGYMDHGHYHQSTPEQDALALAELDLISEHWYDFLFCNCGDAVEHGVRSAGVPYYNAPHADPGAAHHEYFSRDRGGWTRVDFDRLRRQRQSELRNRAATKTCNDQPGCTAGTDVVFFD